MTLPLPALLIAGSSLIVLALGSVHLLFTFWGTRLHPRDATLMTAMQHGLPVITRETTLWKAWIGFNASHSYGAMLFGLMYTYLAVAQPRLLLGSPFLLVLGAALLGAYLHLGFSYWFSVPFRGVALASVLYAAAVLVRVT
jgi:hypothetical protein